MQNKISLRNRKINKYIPLQIYITRSIGSSDVISSEEPIKRAK